MMNVFTSEYKNFEEAREWLKNLLTETEVEITFTKKDGTERVMNCTLQEDILPETVGTNKASNNDALAVFDVDKEDWRSFRWDSIKSVKFTLGD